MCYLSRKLRKEFFHLGRIRDRDLFSTARSGARHLCIIHRSRNVFARRNRRKYSNSKVVRRSLSSNRDGGRKHLPLPPRHAFLSLVFFSSHFILRFITHRHAGEHRRQACTRERRRISLTCLRRFVSRRTVDPISGPRLATYIDEERSTERWKNPRNENTANLSSRNESRFVRSFLNLNQQRQGKDRRRTGA